ncbi:von Willebrand factor A domain-containing protein 5A-like [Argopecten irradians]|uniref:von Willebrand factor A domain-containing protein 5A-like n=1 Tax=Argopecten irradians TaxID=31199 RepID=UPI00371DFC68
MYGLRIQHEVGASSQDKADILPGSKTVPLKSVGVDVTIKGFVANVQSTLTYENQKEAAVETVFVFPIDDQSAVYQFEADIDGRHIVAECQDKEQVHIVSKDNVEKKEKSLEPWEEIESRRAKETVLLLLKSLPVGCFFNVVAFGSSFKWWFTR